MPEISFKAKVIEVYTPDGDLARRQIQTPQFQRRHCEMNAFRTHRKYGGFANSDLFPGILARIRKDLFGPSGILDLGNIPENVSVDGSGFLATVTIEVE